MNKKDEWKVILAILVITSIIFAGFYKAFIADDAVDKIRRGDVVLICIMKDGERVIEPNLVVDKVDSTYLFVNGSASNCRELKPM